MVGRKSMTPVSEVIATAKGLGNFKGSGGSGVLPNQKGDFLWKYNAEHAKSRKKNIQYQE
jgi:hypothetical protein